MKYLSYRNLYQPGGPEFSEQQAKIIASQFEVTDGRKGPQASNVKVL